MVWKRGAMKRSLSAESMAPPGSKCNLRGAEPQVRPAPARTAGEARGHLHAQTRCRRHSSLALGKHLKKELGKTTDWKSRTWSLSSVSTESRGTVSPRFNVIVSMRRIENVGCVWGADCTVHSKLMWSWEARMFAVLPLRDISPWFTPT